MLVAAPQALPLQTLVLSACVVPLTVRQITALAPVPLILPEASATAALAVTTSVAAPHATLAPLRVPRAA